jgi:hypothetical protein
MKKKTKDRLIFGLKIITVLSLGVAAGYAIYRRRDKAYNSLPDSKFVGNMMKGKRTEQNSRQNSSEHLLFRHCIIPDHHRNGELNNNKLIIMYARTLLYK